MDLSLNIEEVLGRIKKRAGEIVFDGNHQAGGFYKKRKES